LAARADKRAEKARAKDVAEKLLLNDWIEIEGMWAAHAIEGRVHRDGPHYVRKCAAARAAGECSARSCCAAAAERVRAVCFGHRYRVHVPREDFGNFLFLGGQARFTNVWGSDARIFAIPAQVDAALGFQIEIGPEAIGGTCIFVSGLEVRACA
jgi:hypothetical protein